ncbi:MAG: NAD(P)/FAD-dependent oxidoreductase [Melioribacteraceae bacterium]|nr:NAD(P)/FAD-dependent oxidoreductase [Melioribacteraceae bacterium]WKZ70787.1 MAG: NAD(P)/FAD-dependent oxidoreductase [Melioribacteraceae bacterium]
MNNKKIVIIGGGFGGITLAKKLKNTDYQIKIIDKSNHHLFQPLLYQVAAAALSPGDIAVPIRSEFSNSKNVEVILGEVINIDRAKKKVITKDDQYEYDFLVVAIGNKHSYFGNDQWENYAPGLKTISDALNIRERMLLAFEKAELAKTENEKRKEMTFVIVGGGPTGVEVAGAIAEISKETLLKDFRNINTADTKIILVEGADKILQTFDQPLNDKAKQTLEKLGVEVRLNSFVKEINENGVLVGSEFIEASNVIWAAGNKVSPILENLETELDKSGRVIVDQDCSLKDDPNIFVIGDAALFIENGKPLPGVAPVAMQQGRYVAKILKKNLQKEFRKPFKYFDKGNLATIGRAKAVLQIGNFKISGFFAWLVWALVHIAFLVNFRKRYRVMTEWIWYYLTFRNGIRLITKNDK